MWSFNSHAAVADSTIVDIYNLTTGSFVNGGTTLDPGDQIKVIVKQNDAGFCSKDVQLIVSDINLHEFLHDDPLNNDDGSYGLYGNSW